MARPSAPHPTAGLVLIRLFIGLLLVVQGWGAVNGDEVDGRFVKNAVEDTVADAPALVAWWGETVLLSNPDGVAFLLRWSVLIGGLLLLLGGLTRPVGTLLGLLMLQLFFYSEGDVRLTFALVSLSCLACALSRAGRRFGLDTMFDQHFPSWVTWTRGREVPFPG